MQILLPTVVIFFDFLLPGVLLLWLWKSRARTRAYLCSVVVLTAVYLLAVKVWIFGYWHAVGVFWPFAFFALFLLAVVCRSREVPSRWFPARWSKEFFLCGLNIAHAFVWALLIVSAFQARSVQEQALELSAPLRNGTFWIIGGGGNVSVNHHTRSVRYALDISQLNSTGLRARSAAPFPQDLSKYKIFGAEVIAPCSGEVLAVDDSAPDRLPLHPDDSGIGNFVALFCQEHTVRLVHLRARSVKVSVGDFVMTGQPLGNVGNSGNTVEPHLHIDAVAGRKVLNVRRDGGVKSVPIKINGRFLVKGDTFVN